MSRIIDSQGEDRPYDDENLPEIPPIGHPVPQKVISFVHALRRRMEEDPDNVKKTSWVWEVKYSKWHPPNKANSPGSQRRIRRKASFEEEESEGSNTSPEIEDTKNVFRVLREMRKTIAVTLEQQRGLEANQNAFITLLLKEKEEGRKADREEIKLVMDSYKAILEKQNALIGKLLTDQELSLEDRVEFLKKYKEMILGSGADDGIKKSLIDGAQKLLEIFGPGIANKAKKLGLLE